MILPPVSRLREHVRDFMAGRLAPNYVTYACVRHMMGPDSRLAWRCEVPGCRNHARWWTERLGVKPLLLCGRHDRMSLPRLRDRGVQVQEL